MMEIRKKKIKNYIVFKKSANENEKKTLFASKLK